MSSTRALTRGVLHSPHPKTLSSHSQRAAPMYICDRCISHLSGSLNPKSRPVEVARPSHALEEDLSSSQPDFRRIFGRPAWSVRSLLPTSSSPAQPSPEEEPISSETLHHLLRISALPAPSTPQEESSMLHTLHTQLHFVRDVQSVDTTGVAPLRAVRDETSAGVSEATVTLSSLRDALGRESVMGHRRRPRRNRDVERLRSEEEILVEAATSGRRDRGYYLVHKGKAKGVE